MQLSLIIPAYNAANYLCRCVESLACQDLSHDCYEAIVINDGSTDDTESILNSLCEKYSFVRYLTTPNGGLSRARNRGVEEAKGEYLLFLDADDSLVEHTLGPIYEEMSKGQLDMMLLNYRHISTEGGLLASPFCMDKNSHEVVSGRAFLFDDHFPPMVCMYAFRRLFLLEKKLAMIPIWHEDEEFTPRAIYLAERIKYCPLLFYNYFQNSNSYMNHYNETKLLYVIEAMGSLNVFKKKYSTDREMKTYFDNRIAKILMQLFKGSILRGYTNQKSMIQKMKEVGLLTLKPKKFTFYFCLFNLSPSLFVAYYKMHKSGKIENER